MTDVLFYHLTESKLEDALPPLIDKSAARFA
jgi:DNA polymerase IIIc chi subunit